MEEEVYVFETKKLFELSNYPNNWDEFIKELDDLKIKYKVKSRTTYRLSAVGVVFVLEGQKEVVINFIKKHRLVHVKAINLDKFKIGDRVMTPEGIGEVVHNNGRMYESNVDYYLISFYHGKRYCLHKETDLRLIKKEYKIKDEQSPGQDDEVWEYKFILPPTGFFSLSDIDEEFDKDLNEMDFINNRIQLHLYDYDWTGELIKIPNLLAQEAPILISSYTGVAPIAFLFDENDQMFYIYNDRNEPQGAANDRYLKLVKLGDNNE